MVIKEVKITTDDGQEFFVVPAINTKKTLIKQPEAKTLDAHGNEDKTHSTEKDVVFPALLLLKESCPNFWIDCDEGYGHTLEI